MSYGYEYAVAAQANASARATFIRRTYAHLAGAILAFMGIEAVLVNVVSEQTIINIFAATPYSWLFVLLAFMGASWLAQSWAQSQASPGLQYLGLGLYVVAQAVIFLPIIYAATHYFQDPKIIPIAGILTLAVFGGLTLSVFVTRKDYSFLAPILCVGSLLALGLIVAAILFGAGSFLGLFFSFAMVALMSGYILYYTSNILLHYRTDQHVAAALALFAAVATLFWYVLRIVMAFSSRD
jgi:FtsH-binding integral membrane protein